MEAPCDEKSRHGMQGSSKRPIVVSPQGDSTSAMFLPPHAECGQSLRRWLLLSPLPECSNPASKPILYGKTKTTTG
jgi:hypothetical protein